METAGTDDRGSRGGLSAEQLAGLLEAVSSVGREVELERMLRRVVESATSLVDATYGALGIVDPETETLTDFLYVGIDATDAHAIGPLPTGKGLLGELIRDPRPLRVADVAHDDRAGHFPPNHPAMTTFLGVPIRVRGEVFGNLYLTDKRDGAMFDDGDEQMAVALAAIAGVGVENARLHRRVSDLVRIEERERIGRELHDTIVQRIFSIGLALQSLSGRLEGEAATTLARAAADLDETVQQIRATVLQLDEEPPGAVGRELVESIDELAERFVLTVSMRIDPSIDRELHEGRADLTQALREAVHRALTALAPDIGTRMVSLHLRANAHLTLRISCDAALPDAIARLNELRHQAEKLGGHLSIHLDGEHTDISWTVPLA